MSRIVDAAEAVMHSAGEAYFEPNRTVRERHELAHSHKLDPLKSFSLIAREELQDV